MEFDKPEVTIGRVQGNDIILPKGNVSKRHSRIVLKDGRFIIVDLKSTNGTYVNGRKITSPLVIKGGDKIYIGDFILGIEEGAGAPSEAPGVRPVPQPVGAPVQAQPQMPPPQMQPMPPMQPPPMQPPPQMQPPPMQPPPQMQPPPMAPPQQPPPPQVPPQQRATGGPPPMPRQPQPPMAIPGPPLRAPSPVVQPPPPQPQPPQPQPAMTMPLGSAGPQPPPAQNVRPQPGVISSPPLAMQPSPPIPAYAPPVSPPHPMSMRPEPIATPQPPPEPLAPPMAQAPVPVAPMHAEPVQHRRGDRQVEAYQELLGKIHDRLIERMDLRRLDLDSLADEELWQRTRSTVQTIIDQADAGHEIDDFVDRGRLLQDVLNEALGLGPLEELLDDEHVTEVMVNHAQQIYVERDGHLTPVDKTFSSDKAVLGVIERIVAPIGRRIDESSPMVDARLRDGSRVNAIIPPLAIRGPCVTIRKFRRDMLGPADLIRLRTFNRQIAEFLEVCVKYRKSIVISGGTGSGKTTTLNMLASYIPDSERIVSIEDAAELQLPQDHVVSLETKPPNIEGKGEVTIRDLVRNSLRMRPDRIVVGECRGGEALDMLQAMNTGHDGSLTTLHANNTRDALSRLETMVLMSGMDLPVRAIREQIASAIDIIVQQTRFADGSRIITQVAEVTGMEGDVITMQDIFLFQQEGFDNQGKVRGRFVATGLVPKFYSELTSRGLKVNMSIFSPDGVM
jgi:pilus assembly protein CpaF